MIISGIIVEKDINHWIFREWIYNESYTLFSKNGYVLILSHANNIKCLELKEMINNSETVARFIFNSSKGDLLFDLIEERELIRHLLYINNELIESFGIKLQPENKNNNLKDKLDDLLYTLFNLTIVDFVLKSKINDEYNVKNYNEKNNSFFDFYLLLMSPRVLLLYILSPYLLYLLIRMLINSETIGEVGFLIYPLIIVALPLLILTMLINRALRNRRELNKYIYKNKKIELLKVHTD